MSRSGAVKKSLTLAGFLTLVVVVVVWALPELSPRAIARHERAIRSAIAAHPWEAMGLATLLYTLVALVPGTSGKSIITGWLFGFSEGLVIVMIGLAIAAHAMFLLSRYALRDAIRARLSARLIRWDRRLAGDGSWFLLAARWAHSPYTLVNVVCGVSSVPLRVFTWTTILGVLPGSIIFVWMGSRLPTLERLIAGGPKAFVDPWLWTALALTALLPAAVRWWIVRRRRRASGESSAVPKEEPWKASC